MIRRIMKTAALAAVTLAAVRSGAVTGQSVTAQSPAQIAFARFKALEGDWISELSGGAKAYSKYQVVSNGQAVLEHYRADNLPGAGNMITMYHLDGERLVLEHYCVAGNHPRMKASLIRGDEVAFELMDVANLARPGAGHMANAKFSFAGPDNFTTSWQFVEDGKVKFTETSRFARVR